ncbi:hypothetical protein BaLi_c20120 [Bacillus paralicheniformis ATCC 9945a]|nr:hypothetical protein BaLi_c20120 [Bacillus paralicheniformis ATCC 9945a]
MKGCTNATVLQNFVNIQLIIERHILFRQEVAFLMFLSYNSITLHCT